MQISLAHVSDFDDLIRLHKQALSRDLLQEFGDRMIRLFFLSLLQMHDAFVYRITDRQQVIGYAAGVHSSKTVMGSMMRLHFFPMLYLLVSGSLRKPSLVTNLWKTIFFSSTIIEGPQLLSFVVDKQYQRHGAGSILLEQVKKEFHRRGFTFFFVGVHTTMKQAREFYEHRGGELVSTSTLPGRAIMWYKYATT